MMQRKVPFVVSRNYGKFLPVQNCSRWIGELGGFCQAPYDVWSAWGSYGSGGNADLYAWTNAELTQLVFESSGGRSIDCSSGSGHCIKVQDAKPGIYLMEGVLNVTYVFHDPASNRLGDSALTFPNQIPFTFYLQILAPFTESE